MKRWCVGVSFLLLSLCPSAVLAEVGFDYLAIRIESGWDCDSMLKALHTIPNRVPIGWLDDTTFGTSTSCLSQLLSSGKVSKARAHLLNNTCVRNRNCWAGDQLHGYTLPQIEREAVVPGSRLLDLVCRGAARIQEYAKKYPNVRFRVSGLLEHNMSRDAASSVVNTVHRCAPDVDPVDNPSLPYPPIAGAIRESHGPSVNPITSLDGQSLEAVDVESWKKANATGDMTLIWALPMNCRLASGWIQPNLRKSCPTADDFALYARAWFTQKPAPAQKPPMCATIGQISAPSFYKTAAENDGSGNPQAGKPLFSTTARAEQADVYTAAGQKIASFGLAGQGSDRSWRYSLGVGSGETAFRLGQLAGDDAGTSWVALKVGETCFWADAYRSGPVPPARPNPFSFLRERQNLQKRPNGTHAGHTAP